MNLSSGAVQSRHRTSPIGTPDSKYETRSGEVVPTRHRILRWDEIESWQRDNEYVTGHYRQASYSYQASIESLGYLHNESINIYTHLGGALAMIAVSLLHLRAFISPGSDATASDAIVFGTFLAAAIICLSCSTLFHTMMDHSRRLWQITNFADFMGILALITGSFYPGIYYGFYCHTAIIYTYWTMITIASCGCVIICSLPVFSTPEWRTTRAVLFVSLGLSGILPVLHSVALHGWEGAKQVGMGCYIVEAVFYVIGAMIYSARVPERWRPGTFDVWCASHQILHIMVLFGVTFHMLGMMTGYATAHNAQLIKCFPS